VKTEEKTRVRGAAAALERPETRIALAPKRWPVLAATLTLLACLALPSCRSAAGKRNRPVLARGRVLVRVSDPRGQPISGVHLTLTAPNGTKTATAATKPDGTAAFDDLSEGRYSLTARPTGARRSRSTHVAVRAGLESTVILTLEADDADTVIVKPKPH
jgi:hypothetical protein